MSVSRGMCSTEQGSVRVRRNRVGEVRQFAICQEICGSRGDVQCGLGELNPGCAWLDPLRAFAGVAFIHGGNNWLVLYAIPTLLPHAPQAYAALAVALPLGW